MGDCFAACMASILELPLVAVPPGLGTTERWLEPANAWLAPMGLTLVFFGTPLYYDPGLHDFEARVIHRGQRIVDEVVSRAEIEAKRRTSPWKF